MKEEKNAYKFQKENYECVRAYIKKIIGINLKNKLRKENKTIAGWILDNATKYLNE